MIVYVVTAGEHDDYHIEGIFTSLKGAKNYLTFAYPKRKGVDVYSPAIEEWPIDSPELHPQAVAIHREV